MTGIDRIAEPWGTRTPYGPGEDWPTRVDMRLDEGVAGDRRRPMGAVRHDSAAGVSLDWEVLAQTAQALKDRELIGLSQHRHPQTLRQLRRANAQVKEQSAQIMVHCMSNSNRPRPVDGRRQTQGSTGDSCTGFPSSTSSVLHRRSTHRHYEKRRCEGQVRRGLEACATA